MAVDIKKALSSLKERKETMLVWGLGAVAICVGAFLLVGYTRGVTPPSVLEVVVKRKGPMKSEEEIAEEAIAKLKESQKIPPFIDYQDILAKNLFIQSRMVQIEGEGIVGVGGFVLKGLWKEAGRIVAFIQDPAGKPHIVGVGQMVGTSEAKVVAIDFQNQSATLMGKGWEKPQVIRLARVEIGETGGMITFKSSEKKKEVEKVTEEEAKKAIAEARKALSAASDAILTARSEGVDTDEAEARRDDAKVKLEDALGAMKEKDYKRAKELAKSAQALAQEAKKLVGKVEEEKEEEEEITETGREEE